MILSSAQVQRFWREWSTTCQALGWTRAAGLTTAAIDAKRKELLARCGFGSLTQVDRTDGFTKVLHEIIALRGVNLKSARETIDPSLNQARVLRNQLAADLIPCLELYVEVRPYAAETFRFKSVEMRELDLPQLNVAQLIQVRNTFAARLNSLRNKAGDSLHDMKTKAHVPCICAKCVRAEFIHHEVIAGEVPVESKTMPF